MATVDLITTHGPWILLIAFTIASIVSETGLYMTLYVVPGIILYACTFLALKLGRGIEGNDNCEIQKGLWRGDAIPILPFSIILSAMISAASGTFWGLRKASGESGALTKMAGQLTIGLAFWLADIIAFFVVENCYTELLGGTGAQGITRGSSKTGAAIYATLLGAGLGGFAGWANSAARKGNDDDSPTTTCSKEGKAQRFRCRVRQEKL